MSFSIGSIANTMQPLSRHRRPLSRGNAHQTRLRPNGQPRRHASHVMAFKESERDRKAGYSSSNPSPPLQLLNKMRTSSSFKKHVEAVRESWDRVENKASLAVYTTGTLLTLYVASTILDSIDRLPLLPGFFKTTGLVYTGWFAWRYLLFQAGRRDLSKLLTDLKQALNEQSVEIEATGQDLTEASKDVFKTVDHKLGDTIQNVLYRQPQQPDQKTTTSSDISPTPPHLTSKPPAASNRSTELQQGGSAGRDTSSTKSNADESSAAANLPLQHRGGGQQSSTSSSALNHGHTTATPLRSSAGGEQQQRDPQRLTRRERNEDSQRNVIDEDI